MTIVTTPDATGERPAGPTGKRRGVNAGFNPNVDHNGDGVIGLPDFNVLRSYFGRAPGPAGALP